MEDAHQRCMLPRRFVRGWGWLCMMFAVALLTAEGARGAAGDMDLSFHTKGWATFTAGGDGARGMTVQRDGKILLTGISIEQGRPFQPGLWRLNPDGSRDLGFNGSGEVVTVIPGEEGTAATGQVVEVLADGKILVAGGFLPGARTDALLVRYLPDGRLDLGFGPDGQGYVVYNYIAQEYVDAIAALKLQSDGKILAGTSNGRLVRFLANGMPDEGFGSGGVAVFQMSAQVTSVEVQNDGKILCTQEAGPVVWRLLPNGRPDAGFGNLAGGVSITGWTQGAWRVIVLQDGKILVGGTFWSGGGAGSSGFTVARLLPDGTRDASFGAAGGPGRAMATFGGEELFCNMASMHVQSDGRILLAGKVYGDGSPADIALVRFTAEGALDMAFGNGGQVRADLGEGTTDECRAAVMVSDQKLLVAGRYSQFSAPGAGDLLLARFHMPPERALAVEYPPGFALVPGPDTPWNVGPVTVGTRIVEVILHNTGLVPLTGLAVSLTNESHPGEFHVAPPGLTSLEPEEQTSLLVSLTLSAGPGPRTATLQVSSTTQGLAPMEFSLTGARATPLEVWRVTWFGSSDNAGAGADLNDFDRDGLVNFMEYATGGNPHQPAPAAWAAVKNGAGAAMTYTRPAAGPAEFTYQPEAAADPAGPWSGAGLESVVEAEAGGMQTVRVSSLNAAPAARRFFRLRVARL